MSPTTVAIVGTGANPARIPSELDPTRMARRATPIGSPIATTEPKATASTTTATRMPTTSPPSPPSTLA